MILRISNKLQTAIEISDAAMEVRESNVAANTARALEEQPRPQVKRYKQYKRQPNKFPAPKTKSAKKELLRHITACQAKSKVKKTIAKTRITRKRLKLRRLQRKEKRWNSSLIA